MSSDRFLWALESCDLSQTDKSIIWVSSFPSWVMSSRTLNYTKKNIWHLVIWKKMMIWSILSFKNLQHWKAYSFYSFSGERWIWKDWEHSFCKKFRPQLLRDRKRSSANHHSTLGKKTLMWYFCQLEIDHVTQKPKETCQRTCRGP
jgi:DNA modification methylase